nr:hypothetical protein [Endozoicomonas sp.]
MLDKIESPKIDNFQPQCLDKLSSTLKRFEQSDVSKDSSNGDFEQYTQEQVQKNVTQLNLAISTFSQIFDPDNSESPVALPAAGKLYFNNFLILKSVSVYPEAK